MRKALKMAKHKAMCCCYEIMMTKEMLSDEKDYKTIQ